jgi:hypothetical protein
MQTNMSELKQQASADPLGQLDSFTNRIIAWVDTYTAKHGHAPMIPTPTPSAPRAALLLVFAMMIGGGGHFAWQFVTGDRFIQGYEARQQEEARPTEKRYEWLFTSQHTAREYSFVQGPAPKIYEVRFCNEPGFEPGQKLESITYRELGDCKQIISFTAYTDEVTGNRIRFPFERQR